MIQLVENKGPVRTLLDTSARPLITSSRAPRSQIHEASCALLEGLEMSFEGGGILTLGLKLGLQFLNKEFETKNFASQFLDFRSGAGDGSRRRTRNRRRGRLADTHWSWCGDRFPSRRLRVKKAAQNLRRRAQRAIAHRSIRRPRTDGFWVQQAFHAHDQILRLKGLADQLVGFNRHRLFSDGLVHHAGHENHGGSAEPVVLLDEIANFVAVLIRHDDVGDNGVRCGLAELSQCGSGIRASDDVNILLAEGDFDYFAHGGAIVYEVDGGDAGGRECLGFAHDDSFSACSSAAFCSSSKMRMASRSKSVADRSTVRCAAVAPYTNLYTPTDVSWQVFTSCVTASSPKYAPHSAWKISPPSKKTIPSASVALMCNAPV